MPKLRRGPNVKKGRTILFLLTGIILMACSTNKTDKSEIVFSSDNATDIYVTETEDFISTDYLVGIASTQDKMYIATNNEENISSNVYEIDLLTSQTTCLNIAPFADNTALIKDIAVDADENIVAIEQYLIRENVVDAMSQGNIVISTYTSAGEVISSIDITSQIHGSYNGYINGFMIDKDNNYYLLVDKTIQVFSKHGQALFECNPNIKWFVDACVTREGKVAFMAASQNEDGLLLGIIDAQSGNIEKSYYNIEGDIAGGQLTKGTECDLLISSGDIVSEFSLERSEQKPLFKWADSNIAGQQVRFLKDLGNGKMVAVLAEQIGEEYHTKIAYLTKTSIAEIPQKEKLVLATYLSSPQLIEKVNYFNQKSQDYQIEIKAYCRDTYSYEEQKQAYTDMMLDVLTGQGADIVEGYYFDPEFFATKGMIEDLYPYLDADEELKDVDFFDAVLDGNTVEGMLLTIPDSFGIATLVADRRVVGERSGITVDEFMGLIRKCDRDTYSFQYSPEAIVNQIFKAYINEFINWEQQICSFETDEFYKILEFAKEYGLYLDDYAIDMDMSNPLFAQHYLYSVADYKAENLYAYDNLYEGNGYGWVGFPVNEADTSNGAMLDNGQTFWISSQSENKDGAWEFIRTFLLLEYYEMQIEKDIYSVAFPSRIDMYNRVCGEWMTTDIITDENGNEVEVSRHSYYGGWIGTEFAVPITGDDRNAVTQMIEQMGKPAVYDIEISNIIAEEAEPFFQNQKNAEEVTAIIQNRVQLYMNEKL